VDTKFRDTKFREISHQKLISYFAKFLFYFAKFREILWTYFAKFREIKVKIDAKFREIKHATFRRKNKNFMKMMVLFILSHIDI
jgi:hypothetical protein